MQQKVFSPIIIKDLDHPVLLQAWIQHSYDVLKDVHDNRRRQWASGRVALTEALKAQGIVADLMKCQFEGHQRVRELPDWTFSLSNTKDFAGALVIPRSINVSLGLDIELKTRVVVDGVAERMQNAGDLDSLTPLQLWCVKEAIYKSLPSEIQQTIWLNNIEVQAERFGLTGFKLQGLWQLEAHSELVVAMAQTARL